MQISTRRFMHFGALIFMTMALALSAQATTYSKASLKGSYSFLTNLSTANASTNEIGLVGILTFNGAGKVTGSYTSTDGGAVQTGTLTGTYTVTSNGTGTITFTTGSTAKFAIALNNPTTTGVAQGVQLLQTNDSNDEIVSGSAVLQSTTTQTYSVASVKGTFSFQWNEWTANASFPAFGGIDLITFDGKGNVTGTQTYMEEGVLYKESVAGTYTVNSNGTGIFSSSQSASQFAFALNSVAAGQAEGAQFLLTEAPKGNANIVISGTALSTGATKFSKASLKGGYSFMTNLWTANASTTESAMVGVLTFSGAGKVTGSYTQGSGDVFKTGTLGGTYTVSSNGTGTLAFTTGSTAKFAIVLNDATTAGVAQGVQLLQTNDKNNEVVSGTAVLQSTTAETYSVASLNGNFGFQWINWTASTSFPQASILGTISFNGKGSCKDSYTSVFDGKLTTKSDTCTYTVNANGTGSVVFPGSESALSLNAAPSGQAKGAQFLQNVNESGNYVITGTAAAQ